MKTFLSRARVIAKAAPTWLAAFALAAPLIANDAAQLLPANGERVGALILTVGSVAGFAVATIRRLTPVPPTERGILPVDEAA